jgi:hypothetical protein
VEFFKIRTAYDEMGNSPWDAIWYEGDDEDLDVLKGQFRLACVWKAPPAAIQKRKRTPDIYVFQLYSATTQSVCQLLAPLTTDSVEFLPLRIPGHKPLFVLHPLLRIDLDDGAEVERNSVSGNISVIRRYSFARDQVEVGMHILQVRQAPGSAARNAGYACSGILVSAELKELCETNGLCGVAFEKVWSMALK